MVMPALPEQQTSKLPRSVESGPLPGESLSSTGSLDTIPSEPAFYPGKRTIIPDRNNSQSLSASNASLVLDKALLTEDITWSGTVLVKGYVVVAPNVTLRIEAGTVIYFAGTSDGSDAARLVVQGRIQAIGTAESPIVMTSDRTRPDIGDWGGILIVSSEKRNVLEQCRVQYASIGIEAVFSSLNLKFVSVIRSDVCALLRDSYVQMTGGTLSNSGFGIKTYDSELELKDASVVSNKNGIILNNSAVSLTSVVIRDNELYGIFSKNSRIKVSSSEISGNGNGAVIKDGEGQILMTNFSANNRTALRLAGSRIKVQHCRFVNNNHDALQLEDGRALIWGNFFNGNKGFNLYNSGREDVLALQNWWGSTDRSAIIQKIYDGVHNPGSGSVLLFPWLNEKPQLHP